MRTNSSKKIHKIKRDPYKSLIRVLVTMAVLAVVGVGVFYLCSLAVTKDYTDTRDRIMAENAEGEVEFNARMNELRNQSAAQNAPVQNVQADLNLPSWEKTLDGAVWRIEDEGSKGLENTSTITMDRAQLINGGLMLINAWHSVPADFSEEGLLSVGTTGNYKIQVQDASVQLFQPAFDALVEAMEGAKAAGLEHYIVREGYRSVAEQEALFNEEMADLSGRYTGNRLIEETKKKVNYPGTSDYHTGMTMRMDVYQRGNSELNDQKFQAESAQGAWLTKNCWKYGFIIRYPKDKEAITGYMYEPWHVRYLGKETAKKVYESGKCLEEYLGIDSVYAD